MNGKFFFSSRRRHTRLQGDWSSDVCSSDLYVVNARRRFLGVVSSQSLRDALHGRPGMLGLSHAFLPNVEPLSAGTPVAELFGPVAAAPCALPVTSDDGQFMEIGRASCRERV